VHVGRTCLREHLAPLGYFGGKINQ
jgi:hypothetical protein